MLGTLVIIGVGLYYYITNHPQIIIGVIQNALYGDNPINSYEAFNEPGRFIKDDGSLYLTEIKYGDEYPNSYLDITYPNEDTSLDRPTIIFFHGGGYFGGDKAMGDPLAANDDANYLLSSMVQEGYNLVNVNYALVPEYHFPVPVIQANQAIGFLIENADKYNLNMDNVVIMGGSAGAIITAQLGGIITNETYSQLIGISPSIAADKVKALIIDDAPLVFEEFTFNTKLLVGNYINGTMYPTKSELDMYEVIDYVNTEYLPTFLIGSNYNGDGFAKDMKIFADQLTALNVDHEFYYAKNLDGTEPYHGFTADLKNSTNAQQCFKEFMNFIEKYTRT